MNSIDDREQTAYAPLLKLRDKFGETLRGHTSEMGKEAYTEFTSLDSEASSHELEDILWRVFNRHAAEGEFSLQISDAEIALIRTCPVPDEQCDVIDNLMDEPELNIDDSAGTITDETVYEGLDAALSMSAGHITAQVFDLLQESEEADDAELHGYLARWWKDDVTKISLQIMFSHISAALAPRIMCLRFPEIFRGYADIQMDATRMRLSTSYPGENGERDRYKEKLDAIAKDDTYALTALTTDVAMWNTRSYVSLSSRIDDAMNVLKERKAGFIHMLGLKRRIAIARELDDDLGGLNSILEDLMKEIDGQ